MGSRLAGTARLTDRQTNSSQANSRQAGSIHTDSFYKKINKLYSQADQVTNNFYQANSRQADKQLINLWTADQVTSNFYLANSRQADIRHLARRRKKTDRQTSSWQSYGQQTGRQPSNNQQNRWTSRRQADSRKPGSRYLTNKQTSRQRAAVTQLTNRWISCRQADSKKPDSR